MKLRRKMMALMLGIGMLLTASGFTATHAYAAEPDLTGFWTLRIGYGLTTYGTVPANDGTIPPKAFPLYLVQITTIDRLLGKFRLQYVNEVTGCPTPASAGMTNEYYGQIVLPRRPDLGGGRAPVMRAVFTLTAATYPIGGADPTFYAAYAGTGQDSLSTNRGNFAVDPTRLVVDYIYGAFWQASASSPDRGMFELRPHKAPPFAPCTAK